MTISIDKLKKSINIAELLNDEQLVEIGNQVVKGYEIDLASRSEWQSVVDQAMEIAKQTVSTKNFPWKNASNIKFPLITRAAIDFASRVLPEIIQNERVVKTTMIGKDIDGTKARRATNVATFMSYQLLNLMPDWEDGIDTLLQMLPILGTVFKKIYYDPIEYRICSEVCTPDKIVINYHVKCLEDARRITHELMFYMNDVVERQRQKLFLDIDESMINSSLSGDLEDKDRPIDFLEQHCYLDLDEDGYKEPYIVTVHKDSRKVFRIVSRFEDVRLMKNGKIECIKPIHYFTDFHFIKSPDGGFYSMGFGSLLLPLNKAINTLINQLLDSGTLHNMQGGLIGKGLRIKNGNLEFKMGQWQMLDCAAGDDIAKNIYPWPTKEPSSVLYNLLVLLTQIGQDLTSASDATMGKQPAQNVASGTLNQLIEQGTKMFVAINKRLDRSLKKEYTKIFNLNYQYLDQKEYALFLNDENANVKKDFAKGNMTLMPIADASMSSEIQRFSKAQAIQQLRTVDPRESDTYMLRSALQMDEELIKKLIPPQDPNAPPPPELQKIMAETQLLQAEVAKMTADATLSAEQNNLNQLKLGQDVKESESRIQESIARAWKMQQDALNNLRKTMITANKVHSEQDLKGARLAHEIDIGQADTLLKTKQTMIDEKRAEQTKL